jgi:hypothetical protein
MKEVLGAQYCDIGQKNEEECRYEQKKMGRESCTYSKQSKRDE